MAVDYKQAFPIGTGLSLKQQRQNRAVHVPLQMNEWVLHEDFS